MTPHVGDSVPRAMTGTDEARGTIDVDGRRIGWRAVGGGPPLVLVNGYAATANDWDPTLLRLLGASFEVLCPDNRGMGESSLGDPAALSIDAMADDVALLLDAHGIAAAPVVGWSMGGFVAQRLAQRAPARVTRLMLLATDPGGPTAVPPAPATWAALVDHSGTPREQASRLLRVIFPPDVAPGIDRLFGELVAAARATLSVEALAAQERAMLAWHAGETPPAPGPPPLAPAPPPVLIAHGDQDRVIPPANADALAARWPGARVERFADGGHAFMAQEPARVAELIAAFAREIG